jgi:hypothetical protein
VRKTEGRREGLWWKCSTTMTMVMMMTTVMVMVMVMPLRQ